MLEFLPFAAKPNSHIYVLSDWLYNALVIQYLYSLLNDSKENTSCNYHSCQETEFCSHTEDLRVHWLNYNYLFACKSASIKSLYPDFYSKHFHVVILP